jgi:hypothetical protein
MPSDTGLLCSLYVPGFRFPEYAARKNKVSGRMNEGSQTLIGMPMMSVDGAAVFYHEPQPISDVKIPGSRKAPGILTVEEFILKRIYFERNDRVVPNM